MSNYIDDLPHSFFGYVSFDLGAYFTTVLFEFVADAYYRPTLQWRSVRSLRAAHRRYCCRLASNFASFRAQLPHSSPRDPMSSLSLDKDCLWDCLWSLFIDQLLL